MLLEFFAPKHAAIDPATNYCTLDAEMIDSALILSLLNWKFLVLSLKVFLADMTTAWDKIAVLFRTMRHGLMPSQLEGPEMVGLYSFVSTTISLD